MRYKDSLWEYCLHLLYFFSHHHEHIHTHTIAELIEVESLSVYVMLVHCYVVGM